VEELNVENTGTGDTNTKMYMRDNEKEKQTSFYIFSEYLHISFYYYAPKGA
jgi:hypothetical protein